MKKRVRLVDIAEQAGVSKMCVSLALRNDASISEETRQRIHKIADDMGYVPNRIAKGLSSGRTYTIAAIVGGDFHDDYHNQFLKGAIDYATKKGYVLTFALTEGNKELEKEILKKYYEMGIDGYLIFHSGNKEICHFMKKMDIPFVMYTKFFRDIDCSYVVCNDTLGGKMITDYFIKMGHKRIGFIYDYSLRNSSEVENRRAGYQKSLEEAGIEVDSDLLIPYFYDYESVSGKENNELFRALEKENAPTALFVCNDIVASAVFADLKGKGYKIPDDISIAGYEGVYLGKVLDPPLTTVTSPIRKMGKEACKILIQKIEENKGNDNTVKISMPPELTIRKSVKRKEE